MKQILALPILYFLRFFARLQIGKLKKINPNLTIIGVTGSAGKTSTIAAVKAALEENFKIKTTAGSNSESGIPLSLLDIKITGYSPTNWLKYLVLTPIKYFTYSPRLDILIIEMGIDAPTPPKNMDYLLSIIKPNIGIFLNLTPVHLQNFSSLDQIGVEKAKLVNTTTKAVVDPSLKKYLNHQNTLFIKPITIKYHHPLPKIYYHSFGATIATASLFGLDQKTAIKNIQKNFILPPGRSSIFKGIKSSTIIDSSYNSSPLATSEMLEFLSTFSSPKIAVLGDMRELGPAAAGEHLKLYQLALKSADQIISIGPETQKFFGPKASKFLYWWQALKYIKKNLPSKSSLLVKGSQNTIYLEELVKGLLTNKADIQKLCRQSPYWLKIKKEFQKSTP